MKLQGTTGANNSSIHTALQKRLLESGLQFRDGIISYHEFMQHANQITKISIVLPVYFVHIFKPDEYPILDVKVWRAYLEAINRPISKYSKPMSWKHYEQYRKFFYDVQKQTDLPWRLVDKGLWAMGDLIKI